MSLSWKRLIFILIGLVPILFVSQGAIAQSCLCTPSPLKIDPLTFRGGVAGAVDNIAVPYSAQNFHDSCLRPAEAKIIVTVTRKNGHVDSNQNNPFIDQIANGSSGGVPTVQVPRGPLETDPVKYTVTITITKFRVGISPSAVFTGAVSSVKTISQLTSSQDQNEACAPKVGSALLQSVSKAPNGTDDLVHVSWNPQPGCDVNCVGVSSTQVTVKTTHASSATCSSTPTLIPFPGHDTATPLTARCNPEATGDQTVKSIEATIAPQITAGTGSLSATLSGNF